MRLFWDGFRHHPFKTEARKRGRHLEGTGRAAQCWAEVRRDRDGIFFYPSDVNPLVQDCRRPQPGSLFRALLGPFPFSHLEMETSSRHQEHEEPSSGRARRPSQRSIGRPRLIQRSCYPHCFLRSGKGFQAWHKLGGKRFFGDFSGLFIFGSSDTATFKEEEHQKDAFVNGERPDFASCTRGLRAGRKFPGTADGVFCQ